jgi:hypothetical protein
VAQDPQPQQPGQSGQPTQSRQPGQPAPWAAQPPPWAGQPNQWHGPPSEWQGQPNQWQGPPGQWSGPPPERKRQLWPWALLAVVLGLVVLAAVALVSDPDFQAGFREALMEGFGARAGSLEVGACFDGGTADERGNFDDRVAPRACDEPHDSQLISTFAWPGSEPNNAYPGEQLMVDHAEESCLDAFFETVGIDYEFSTLEMIYAYPSAQTWRFGDRTFLCIVRGPGGDKLTRAVDGSRL